RPVRALVGFTGVGRGRRRRGGHGSLSGRHRAIEVRVWLPVGRRVALSARQPEPRSLTPQVPRRAYSCRGRGAFLRGRRRYVLSAGGGEGAHDPVRTGR